MRTVAAFLLATVIDNRLRLALVGVEAPVEAVAERGPALVDEELVALGMGEDGRLHGEEEPCETHVDVFSVEEGCLLVAQEKRRGVEDIGI